MAKTLQQIIIDKLARAGICATTAHHDSHNDLWLYNTDPRGSEAETGWVLVPDIILRKSIRMYRTNAQRRAENEMLRELCGAGGQGCP